MREAQCWLFSVTFTVSSPQKSALSIRLNTSAPSVLADANQLQTQMCCTVTQDQKFLVCAVPLHQPNAVSLAGTSLCGHVTSEILQAPPQQAMQQLRDWRYPCPVYSPDRYRSARLRHRAVPSVIQRRAVSVHPACARARHCVIQQSHSRVTHHGNA